MMLKTFSIQPPFVFLFSAVLLSLHLYYLYVTYLWVASLELPSQLESLIHCLLTSWSRQWWLKIKHSRTQLVFGQGWLYFPDSLEYEQCNHKIITSMKRYESRAECKLCIVWSQFLGHGSHKIILTTNYAPSKQGCSTKYLVTERV